MSELRKIAGRIEDAESIIRGAEYRLRKALAINAPEQVLASCWSRLAAARASQHRLYAVWTVAADNAPAINLRRYSGVPDPADDEEENENQVDANLDFA